MMKTTLTAGLLALSTVAFAGQAAAGCLGNYSASADKPLTTAQVETGTKTTTR